MKNISIGKLLLAMIILMLSMIFASTAFAQTKMDLITQGKLSGVTGLSVVTGNNTVTGVTQPASALQVLRVNSAGTGFEFYTPTSGTVTSIATTSPITGGTITTTGTIGINNSAADGTTKGAASFSANDFNSSSGNISLDFTNSQAATSGQNGFLSSTDWSTFNNKQNSITTGTSAQYFKGDLSLGTFPTNVSTFTNDAGYLTSFSETDPIVKSINGLVKSNGTTISAATVGTDYVTGSSTNTFTNKSGNISQWTNDAGYLTSVVGYVPTSRTININGTSYDLSANRTWTVGDISSFGSYGNPSWLTDLPWSKITSTPTTIGGYGITDYNSLGDARWSLLAHTHTFASLTSTPTTLVGYGITDALSIDGSTVGATTAIQYFATGIQSAVLNGSYILGSFGTGLELIGSTKSKLHLNHSGSDITELGDADVAGLGTRLVIDDNVGDINFYSLGAFAYNGQPILTDISAATLTNKDLTSGTNTFPTFNQNTTGYASALKSATTTVNVAAATAPTVGQVLTATSGTAATWQTPTGGSGITVGTTTITSGTSGRVAYNNGGVYGENAGFSFVPNTSFLAELATIGFSMNNASRYLAFGDYNGINNSTYFDISDIAQTITFFGATTTFNGSNLVYAGQCRSSSSGSAAIPVLGIGQTDLGFFNATTDEIGVTAGGVSRFRFTTSALKSETTGGFNLRRAAGAAATPTYAFNGTAGSGMWLNGTSLAFSVAATNRVEITTNGSVLLAKNGALATTATDGFTYIPTCAGVPTGVPTTQTGMAAIIIDSTNNKMYIYSGGAWRILN